MVTVSLEPPPSSFNAGPPRRRAVGPIVALVAIVAAAAGGFWIGRKTAPRAPAETAVASAPAPAAQPQVPGAVAVPTAPALPPAPAPASGAAPAAPAAAPASAGAPAADGVRRVAFTLAGPFEESIARAVPREDRPIADELGQVVNRLLVWDMQVARDGRRGDRVEILYRPAAPAAAGLPASGEPVVEALRYASQKLGRVLTAYRFQAPGQKWPRYYRGDGSEVELRLVGGPIDDYDQVTSLLRDGRHHKGVDFRTPVGTPVRSPVDGVIERRNWNFRGNGNCLDIRDLATGRHVIFLHLEPLPKEMAAGHHVKKGEVVADSGNTGHSFAPHLHYQLEAPDGRILDPFEVHQTRRATLDGAALAAFGAARAKLDAVLGPLDVASAADPVGGARAP